MSLLPLLTVKSSSADSLANSAKSDRYILPAVLSNIRIILSTSGRQALRANLSSRMLTAYSHCSLGMNLP